MPPPDAVDRRKFLRQSLAASVATSVGAAGLSAASYQRVDGANARVRLGFLGCGARAQAHLHVARRLAAEGAVSVAAVCDVWDGHEGEYAHEAGGRVTRRAYSQGLYPSARKAGLDPADPRQAVKDYRRVLDRADVDAVCVATPDHWHARMALDAFAAGKDVFAEPPLGRTAAEAHAVRAALKQSGRVLTVGVPALAHPVWAAVRAAVDAGQVGPLTHLSASAFRADPRGEWRYYRTWPTMTAQTVDWDLFLGHRFEVAGAAVGPAPAACPFDPATFAQWRCHRAFSDGVLSEWLTPAAARLLAASGLGLPERVVSLSHVLPPGDGRTVADTATVVANYPGGCQLVLTASTVAPGHAPAADECLRGRAGLIRPARDGYELVSAGTPPRGEFRPVAGPAHETEALWREFLDCVRTRQAPATAEPGLNAAVLVGLAQEG